MEHMMFIQKTKKDKRLKYIEEHKNVWPGCLKAHKDSGIERELIWMEGDNIYVYMMGKDLKEAIEKLKSTKIFQDWIEEIKPLLDVRQNFSQEGQIKKLEKVFDLEEQLNNLKE